MGCLWKAKQPAHTAISRCKLHTPFAGCHFAMPDMVVCKHEVKPSPSSNDSDSELDWMCMQCGRCFLTQAAVYAHLGAALGRRDTYRNYVQGTVCPVCEKEFHSRFRLRYHFRKGARACRKASC